MNKKEQGLFSFNTTGEQREIWSSCQYDETSSLCFNESITIEFEGRLNISALKKSCKKLIERHLSLQSCFSGDGKQMIVKEGQPLSFENIKYKNCEDVGNKEKEECLTLFDLENGPLIRFILFSPDTLNRNDKSFLILTAHHIICDGWSWAVLTHDLGKFYNNEVEKIFKPLPRASQYWNFYNYKISSDQRSTISYWKNEFFSPQEVFNLNNIKERPLFRTFSSERVDTICPSEIISPLRDLARKNKMTLYQLLLSAFFMMLSKKANTQDITVGISQAGQTAPDFSDLVGHCVGLFPIRMKNFNSQKLEDNFSLVKEKMIAAQNHSHLSFGEICELTIKERDPSRVPLVPITFNLDVQPPDQGLNFKGLKSSFKTNPRYFENFEMFINFTLIGDNAVIENQYNTDLYTKTEVEDFQLCFRTYLEHLAKGNISTDFNFDHYFHYRVNSPLSDLEKSEQSVDSDIYDGETIESVINQDLLNIVRTIWKETLLVDHIDLTDGFFTLGGHSLLVTEVILAIKEKLNISLTMKDLFLNQEFHQFVKVVNDKFKGNFAEKVLQNNDLDDQGDYQITHRENEKLRENIPLSWQQQRTWLFQKIIPETTLFNLPSLFQFKGKLDVEKLRDALLHFQRSHPLINCTLKTINGIPYWQTNSDFHYEVEIVKLEKEYPGLSIEEIIKALVEKHTEEANQSIDIEKRLYFAKLYTFQNDDGLQFTFLAQKVHHIIWDGWCYDIFLEELERNYRCLIDNEKLECTYDINYFDYTNWQNDLPEKRFYQEKINFWRSQFDSIPDPLDLPLKSGFKRAQKSFIGHSKFIYWSEETVVPLEKIARVNGTTLFNVLLTAFKIFLNRYTGQNDIVVGTPVRGRDAKGLDKVIGYFVNNIAIRSSIDPNLTFADNLVRVVHNSSMAFENSLVPFDVVVKEVVKERDQTRTPLYQAFFMYQDATNRTIDFCGAERSSYRLPRGACHTDIDFWARRDREGMIGGFDFDKELFSLEQMDQMVSDFKFFLSEIAKLDQKKSLVKEAVILNPTHSKYILNELNNTEVEYPKDKTVADLIDEASYEFKDKAAVVSDGKILTYEELTKFSDSLASYLVSKGIRSGDLVGMALPRNHYLPACLLGIIKSGAGYVPLDPTYPDDRLSYMIENSKIDFVLCDESEKNDKIFQNVEIITLSDPLSSKQGVWSTEIHQDYQKVRGSINKEDTCYVIYTSGSTGKPKGVDISHGSMINFLQSMIKCPGISSDDNLVAVTTLSFDIAVLEIYTPLLVGAKLVLCTKDESMFGDSLMEVIRKNKGTFLQATPATWRQLLVSGLNSYSDECRRFGKSFKALCGGEAFPVDLKSKLLASVGELWNMYGPTETTVWSTCHKIQENESWPSIGRPIDNTNIYILSENLEVCPYGTIGEICIGGDGLARGYLNRPELTKERFIPCDSLNGEVVYRTGDLGRYRENGLLECLGRNDGQVKVRGFRIELGEIESIISYVKGIKAQVVTVREDRPGDARIVAYFISESEDPSKTEKLILNIKEKLKGNLPPYMMPSHFVELKDFPLTLNGKIDRKKLPSPYEVDNNTEENPDPVISEVGPSLREGFSKIWCECLNVKKVKDDDDFFHSGGHSLLSVTLFSRIETELGLTLPLSTLFQKTTFGELLLELKSVGKEELSPSSIESLDSEYIVILRKGEKRKKALFLFHGVGGNILNYKKMIHFIPNDFDVYGVQSPGVLGEAELASSVPDMAVLYANDISKVKGYEVILFGGGSMGGLLSFETARELRDLNGRVDDIIMFDTFGPRSAFKNIKGQKTTGLFSRFKTYSYFKVREIHAKFHYWLANLKKRPVPHKYRHFLVELNNYGLMNKHNILPFDTHVHLLRAPIEKDGNYSLEDLGWKQVASKGCTSHFVKGTDHFNFVESPMTGKCFRKVLERF